MWSRLDNIGAKLALSTTAPAKKNVRGQQIDQREKKDKKQTAHNGKHCHSSIHRHRFEILIEVTLPNRVDNNIGSFILSNFFDNSGEILRFIVGSMCGSIREV